MASDRKRCLKVISAILGFLGGSRLARNSGSEQLSKLGLFVNPGLLYCNLGMSALLGVGQPLPTEVAARVAFQVAQGLRWIHARRIAHGDLSPWNILIDSSHVVRIIDFGCSEFLDCRTPGPSADELRRYGLCQVTIPYRAPEILFVDISRGT